MMYFFLFPFILLPFPSQVQIFPPHPVLKQPQSKSHLQWTVQTDVMWTSLFSSAFTSVLIRVDENQEGTNSFPLSVYSAQPNTLNSPMVSPVSSSSPTSTQRIENGGSKCAKPSRGGLEQLVTNYNNSKIAVVNLLHLRKQNFKKSAKFGSWMTEQHPIQSQLKMFIIYTQLGYNTFRLE